MKNLIVFDLDGTLAESKSSIDAEMANLSILCLPLSKWLSYPAARGHNSKSKWWLTFATTMA